MLSFQGLMATEGRHQVVGVSFASFVHQTDDTQRTLGMSCPEDELDLYSDQWGRVSHPRVPETSLLFNMGAFHRPSVPQTLHGLSNAAFVEVGADCICSMWDDDDISPEDRILRTKAAILAFHPRPVIVSYSRGWFVNARTLHGHLFVCEEGRLWGGCLAWNHSAWESSGFWDAPMPGYDRYFVERATGRGARTVSIVAPDERLPIALCHDKNVATFPQSKGEPMEKKLEEWLPDGVFKEVKRFQKFCHDNRIFPPWSE